MNYKNTNTTQGKRLHVMEKFEIIQQGLFH
jgi:hypothetical protein